MTSPIRSRSESSSPFDQESYETLTCSEPPKSTESVGTAEDAACHLPSGGGEVNPPSTTSDEHGATRERAAKGGAPTFSATFEEGAWAMSGEVFAIKGRDVRTGIEVEVFSAGARTSPLQDEAQVGMARMGGASDSRHFAARAEVMTAKYHAGTENPDGTTGLNLGIGATTVGAEVTGTLGFVTGTFGMSAGVTLAGSIGIGDRDVDGEPEVCATAAGGIWSGGICVEKFW